MEDFSSLFLMLEVRRGKQRAREEEEIILMGKRTMVQEEALARDLLGEQRKDKLGSGAGMRSHSNSMSSAFGDLNP